MNTKPIHFKSLAMANLSKPFLTKSPIVGIKQFTNLQHSDQINSYQKSPTDEVNPLLPRYLQF